jgi:hypothetical protein
MAPPTVLAILCTTYVLRLGIVPIVLAAVGKAEVVYGLLMCGARDALSEAWTCCRAHDQTCAAMVIERRVGKGRSTPATTAAIAAAATVKIRLVFIPLPGFVSAGARTTVRSRHRGRECDNPTRAAARNLPRPTIG